MGRSGLGGGDSGDPGDGQKEHLPTGHEAKRWREQGGLVPRLKGLGA